MHSLKNYNSKSCHNRLYGTVEVNWFNQPYLIRVLKIGETISVAGLVKQFGSKISIEPKEYEIGDKKIIQED